MNARMHGVSSATSDVVGWLRRRTATFPRPPATRAAAAAGLTLVECLVCLAVLGLALGTSAAFLARFVPQERLNHAARTVVALCRQARVEAIKCNTRILLDCDGAANTCRLTDPGTGRLVGSVDFTKPEYGVTISKSLRTHFSGRGNASPAGKVTIRDQAGASRTITVRTSGGVVSK